MISSGGNGKRVADILQWPAEEYTNFSSFTDDELANSHAWLSSICESSETIFALPGPLVHPSKAATAASKSTKSQQGRGGYAGGIPELVAKLRQLEDDRAALEEEAVHLPLLRLASHESLNALKSSLDGTAGLSRNLQQLWDTHYAHWVQSNKPTALYGAGPQAKDMLRASLAAHSLTKTVESIRQAATDAKQIPPPLEVIDKQAGEHFEKTIKVLEARSKLSQA